MMELSVTRFRQGKHELYLSVLSAGELTPRCQVDVYRPGPEPTGYQRDPTVSRVRAVARYVSDTHGLGLMPTAVLVNIREGAVFTPERPESRKGTLYVPDDEWFWVEDGQHRYKGLELAAEKYGFKPDDYDVPVVFTTVSLPEERDIFVVVNDKAKSVPTDLTSTLFMDQFGEAVRGMTGGEDDKILTATEMRKAAGVYIASRLAKEPGPWHERIRLANEDRTVSGHKPISLSNFVTSLQPFLKDAWVMRQIQGTGPDSPQWRRLYEIVRTYWLVIDEMMPEAAADNVGYALHRPLGAYVFHDVLPDFIDEARNAGGDFSPEFFRKKLADLQEWVLSEAWNAGEGAEPIMQTSSRKAIQWIAAQMRTLLAEAHELDGEVD
jgi:DGQHR domain-containing protein